MGIESVLEMRSDVRCGETEPGERPRELGDAWSEAPGEDGCGVPRAQAHDLAATDTMTGTPRRRDRDAHDVEARARSHEVSACIGLARVPSTVSTARMSPSAQIGQRRRAASVRSQFSYCFDRLTVPKLGPEHDRRPATAVSRLEVTTTLISETEESGSAGPRHSCAGRLRIDVQRDSVAIRLEQGTNGWTREALAVPERRRPGSGQRA